MTKFIILKDVSQKLEYRRKRCIRLKAKIQFLKEHIKQVEETNALLRETLNHFIK
jgi:hypothetical protein